MPDLSSLLAPLESAVSAVLAGAHAALVGLGADPASGPGWVAAIVALVLVVRAATLPLVVHQLRGARAAARARPHLAELTARYRGRTDAESLRAYRRDVAAVRAEHGAGGMGCLPLLVQLPVLYALYRVLLAVSHHESVGAMTPEAVRLADAARVAGVSLGDTVGAVLGGGAPGPVAALAVLVALAAGLTYATQRWFVLPGTALDDLPEPMVAVQRLLPVLSVVGIIVGAAAVPAGILVYWVTTNAWTLLQQAAVNRWWPAPGSAAARRRAAR